MAKRGSQFSINELQRARASAEKLPRGQMRKVAGLGDSVGPAKTRGQQILSRANAMSDPLRREKALHNIKEVFKDLG